ncbi:hypothetical protein HanXRQr2_Chr04g0173091 [Helianthus annuus]|uniref:Uncharacterized protein n=1 Tax=Helianthus annuus TaxID=4232 RepID=A0A251V0P7_HELAN|nr:hypothetical protein HanXRQr2_Chr04g0173091 [Helianthus annuus]KAJ0589477.1 hypothetical protein HanIR_Chr04g0186701 [Helianthus annuus]KAJ0931853.1 hypothetical protein HanPSC8_Chr04g0166781 [Helianthus annuus]
MEKTIMPLFILQKRTEPPLGSHFFFPNLFRAITKPLAFSDPIPCSTSLTNYLLNPQVSLERKRSRRKIHIAGKTIRRRRPNRSLAGTRRRCRNLPEDPTRWRSSSQAGTADLRFG